MLGFHAGWFENKAGERVTSPTGTRVLYEMYPPMIRNWIARQGGLSSRTIVLEGRELAAIYPYCKGTGSTGQTVGPEGGLSRR